jgi:parallel beta-helix repeat protein
VSGTRNLGNLGYGVVLSQNAGNLVEDNDIEHCGAYGILAIFADQNTVASNVFSGNAEGNELYIG